MTPPAARLLRAGDPDTLTLLRDTLASGATLGEVAAAFGFAGRSTLVSIARSTPAVKEIITTHGRKRGRPARKVPTHE
jgi:hypothetical protein